MLDNQEGQKTVNGYSKYAILGGMTALFCAMLVLGGSAAAQDKPASKEAASSATYKIGVVNMQEVLAGYNKRKQKYDELQKEVDGLQKEIDAMSTSIEADKKKYEEGKSTMPEDARDQLKNKVERDYITYRAKLEEHQKTIDNMEERVLKEVFKDIEAAITEIATKGNYHLVLNASSGPRGSVLFFQPSIDMTPQVLTKLNGQ